MVQLTLQSVVLCTVLTTVSSTCTQLPPCIAKLNCRICSDNVHHRYRRRDPSDRSVRPVAHASALAAQILYRRAGYACLIPQSSLYCVSLFFTLSIAEKSRKETNAYLVTFASPEDVPLPKFEGLSFAEKGRLLLCLPLRTVLA